METLAYLYAMAQCFLCLQGLIDRVVLPFKIKNSSLNFCLKVSKKIQFNNYYKQTLFSLGRLLKIGLDRSYEGTRCFSGFFWL